MQRFALFVDAGYLYAEGGKLCCGTASRRRFMVNERELNVMLAKMMRERCGLSFLRTYWYDGARHGVRTVSQQAIACLPNVKLRLGRVNAGGQQKGVDALIYRDLMTLARDRAIGEAFLLAGDEDLREGVREAQDKGVRVTLIGVTPEPGTRNQSQELVYESDDVVTLTREDIYAFFATLEGPSPQVGGRADLADVGESFAIRWLESANTDEIRTLLENRPRIPPMIDSELIHSGEQTVGTSLRGNEEARHQLRSSFWNIVADMQNE